MMAAGTGLSRRSSLALSQAVVEETGVDPDTVDLHYQVGLRDPLIEQIAWAIRGEMTDPAPAGKMRRSADFARAFSEATGTVPHRYLTCRCS